MNASSTLLESTVPTNYWHRLEDGRVQCDLCPRFCKLHEGQRGSASSGCEGGQVVLTSYGRASGFCIDPIEKKPLAHFLPGERAYSRSAPPGATSVAGSVENWSIPTSEGDGRARLAAVTPEAVADEGAGPGSREHRVHLQRPGDLRGVRDRHRVCVPGTRRASGRGHPGAATSPSARAVSFSPRWTCDEHRPQGFHGAVLSQALPRHAPPVLETLEYLSHETSMLARDDDAPDPRRERLGRRARRPDAVGRRKARPRRSVALHGLSPRLPDARPPAHSRRDYLRRAREIAQR